MRNIQGPECHPFVADAKRVFYVSGNPNASYSRGKAKSVIVFPVSCSVSIRDGFP